MKPRLDILHDMTGDGQRIVMATVTGQLSEAEKIYGPLPYSNPSRKAERYSSRILVNQLYPDACLKHGSHGEPLLGNCNEYTHISISHTSDKIAVIFSNDNTGIDIESSERNMNRVAPRFLSEHERKTAAKTGLVAAWCAKEAFYKFLQGKGVTFLNEYTIVSCSKNVINIEYQGKTFPVKYLIIDEILLAYL